MPVVLGAPARSWIRCPAASRNTLATGKNPAVSFHRWITQNGTRFLPFAVDRIVAHDVFISYSSKDKPVADALCARLERDNIRCWIAPRDVLPGIPYAESLTDALGASRLMVLILSAGSNQSRHVMREVESAVGRGIPIVPLRIEDVQPSKALDYYLKSIHWLDALTPPLETHLRTLSHTVQAVLSREPAGALDEQTAVNGAMDRAASEQRRPRQNLNRPLLIGGTAAAMLVLSGLVFWGVLAALGSKPQTSQSSAAMRPTGAKPETTKEPPSGPAAEKQAGENEPAPSKAIAAPVNYALRFEQDGDRVQFDDTIVKTQQEWTVEGWVMPRDPLPRAGHALVFFVDPAWLSLRNSGPRWAVFGPMTRPVGIIYAKERAFTNRWDHVAICYGTQGLSFFVNGQRQGEALPLAVRIGESRVQVCPAGDKSKGDAEFKGDIDEIRVSDIERYDDQFIPAARFEPDDHTLALYHFDEGQGEAAKDSSGHNRHGRITHAKRVTSQRALDSQEQQPP